jgi:N-acetylneuraminate synthase
VRFAERSVGLSAPPLIVAELSGNHNGELARALAIVDAAADAGAHAVKLQTYTADTMTLDEDGPDFTIDDPKSLWNGRRLYDLYREAATPWEWHEPLFARARERGMLCFSTPFDESAVAYLERFEPPAYKIASFELTDLPLIETVARTGRPLVMSTGMATLAEIDEAVRTARAAGGADLVLLQCTSTYPATPDNSNLATITNMRAAFGCETGLSDHTGGIGAAVAAVALGAVLIEKHVTLRRADGGVDAAFSLEPEELRALVVESERAWRAVGTVRYGPTQAERPSLRFRRSIYVSANVRAGEEFGTHNLRIVRPGFGLAPKHFASVLGRRATSDLPRGTALAWLHLA